ncbi:hypothetical protein NDU88_005982 [Pleurodeles waltl]|uniref:Uncharacterized protein n=1 Tax=Pleurodeles waltl TaxID=8319 RepID=A0AAV7W9B6_PLEWA|nr:hypothetical protein NDU88_005982 [Pleurodeles waltl]
MHTDYYKCFPEANAPTPTAAARLDALGMTSLSKTPVPVLMQEDRTVKPSITIRDDYIESDPDEQPKEGKLLRDTATWGQ